ncbi:hypothetical protein H4R35_001167 [Dimargaris xerosporica]|nr:hypothetical protein H4R35_001167 [Dimargaris xerosporica]
MAAWTWPWSRPRSQPASPCSPTETVLDHSHSVPKKSYFERLGLFSELPSYGGPFDVGCYDLEWQWDPADFAVGTDKAATPPRTAKDTSDNKPSSPRYTLVRFYYPADVVGTEMRPTWIPQPIDVYLNGYLAATNLPSMAKSLITKLVTTSIKLPAYLDAKLGCPNQPATGHKPHRDAPVDDKPPISLPQRLPVVFFLHGLWSCRTTYSTLCGQLASYGFLVCAFEFRDGSSSVTHTPNQTVYHTPLPTNQGLEIRQRQQAHRLEELQAGYQLLKGLNQGHPVTNLMPQSETSGSRFALADLTDRLDFGNAFLVGHSFGSATVLYALNQLSPQDYPIKAAIPLDPWMYPLDRTTPLTDKPLLIVNSQMFTGWTEQYDVQLLPYIASRKSAVSLATTGTSDKAKAEKCDSSDSDHPNSVLVTIQGSEHQHQSDFPAVLATWASLNQYLRRTTPGIDPTYCLQLNTRLCLWFLRRHLSPGVLPLPEDTTIMSADPNQQPPEVRVNQWF